MKISLLFDAIGPGFVSISPDKIAVSFEKSTIISGVVFLRGSDILILFTNIYF